MPLFQIPTDIWLNFSHDDYAMSASIAYVPGCSDRVSLAAFCSSLGQIVNIFSDFQGLACQRSGCLNPLEVPGQVILKKPRFVNLQPGSVLSVSIRWLYAESSSGVAVLLDEKFVASFNTSQAADNITNIDIAVPSTWAPGVHSVVIYSILIGVARNSSFNVKGRVFSSPQVSFVLPSPTLPYEDSSILQIGVSSFVGSFDDASNLKLSCIENIIESSAPVSLSDDNLLSISATFKPSLSSSLGIVEATISCELVNSNPGNSYTIPLSLIVSKRVTRIRYFSPTSIVNGVQDTLTVQASGVYEILCLYINDVKISDASGTVFQPSAAPSVQVFPISNAVVGHLMTSPANVLVYIGSCSPPLRKIAEADSRLRVLPPSFPLLLSIFPSIMEYTATRLTIIGQYFDGIQKISMQAVSSVSVTSWNIASLSGSGNRTEILVLFKATAPDTVILNVQIKDSELIGSLVLTHTATVVRPNTLLCLFHWAQSFLCRLVEYCQPSTTAVLGFCSME
jgi:hypothetical protein